MRVAVVHDFHAADVPSGENEVVAAEVEALERAGIEVEMIAVRNDDLARRPLHSLRAAATVATGIGVSPARQLERAQPDVIHVHSLFPYFGRHWIRRAGAPLVATVHSYRPMCASGYLYRDGEVCTLCVDGRRWSGVRFGCYRGSALATLPLAWSARGGAGSDPLLATARQLLVLSERAANVLARAGVPEDRMRLDWHFVPDVVDPGVDEHEERSEAWLFVGRLTPEKGVDRLVAEWPSDVPLRLLGDGELRSTISTLAAGKQVEILGHRPRAEVLAEMRRSFGLVFPSRWYETFGLGYIEALSAGLPTLAFRPNVVADSVKRDGTGAIASWGSVPAAIDDARRVFDGLRDRCRALFSARYTERAFVARRLGLYEELTS